MKNEDASATAALDEELDRALDSIRYRRVNAVPDLEDIMRRAAQAGYRKGIARASILLGMAHYFMEQWTEIEDLVRDGIKYYLENHLWEPPLARAYSILATYYSHSGRPDKAADTFDLAAKVADRTGDPETQISVKNNIAVFYADTGRPDEAIPILEELVSDQYDSQVDSGMRAIHQLNLGSCYRENGDMDRARKWLDAAYQTAEESGLGHILASILDEFGQLALSAGESERALELYRRAVVESKGNAELTYRFGYHTDAARILLSLDRAEEARRELESAAREDLNSVENVEFLLHHHEAFADVAESLGDYQGAAGHLREVARLMVRKYEGNWQAERYREEASQLRETFFDLERVNALGAAIASLEDQEDLFAKIQTSVLSTLEADVFGIALGAGNDEMVRYHPPCGEALESVLRGLVLASSLREGEIVIQDLAREYYRYFEFIEASDVDEAANTASSIMLVPLRTSGNRLGCAFLLSRRPGWWTQERRVVFKTLAQFISIAYWNHRREEAITAELLRSDLSAARDEESGLWNQREFDRRSELIFRVCVRLACPFGLLLIGVDQPSALRGRGGNGSSPLSFIAEVLQRTFRRSTDVVARYEDDAFIIAFAQCDRERARSLAETIRTEVGENSGGMTVSIGAHLGVAGAESQDYADNVRLADAALTRARDAGGDRVVFADDP